MRHPIKQISLPAAFLAALPFLVAPASAARKAPKPAAGGESGTLVVLNKAVSNAKSGDLAIFDASKRSEQRRIRMALDPASTEGRLFGDEMGTSPVRVGSS